MIRSNQHWEIKGGLLEVKSVSENTVLGVRWMGLGNKPTRNSVVTAVASDIRGAGGGFTIAKNELLGSRRMALVKRLPPNLTARKKCVDELLDRTPILPVSTQVVHNISPPSLGLIEYDTIYTDGSWKKSETIREFLNGGGIVRCVGVQ